MKNYPLYVCLIIALSLSGPSHAALSWSAQLPEGAKKKTQSQAQGEHEHGHRGGGQPFYLSDANGAEAEVWLPTLVRRPLDVNEAGIVKVSGTGVDNYHMLYARRQTVERDELALRYQSLRGKPSGESPRLLIAYRKGALDITPTPAPREHRRYLGSGEASFVVRFKNKPLGTHPVLLQTSNGTELELETNGQGELTATLPDDFRNIESGRRNNRPAEFTLITRVLENGKEYVTSLNAEYHVNPSHWQSVWGGGLTILVGFVGGLLVLRRVRKQESDNA